MSYYEIRLQEEAFKSLFQERAILQQHTLSSNQQPSEQPSFFATLILQQRSLLPHTFATAPLSQQLIFPFKHPCATALSRLSLQRLQLQTHSKAMPLNMIFELACSSPEHFLFSVQNQKLCKMSNYAFLTSYLGLLHKRATATMGPMNEVEGLQGISRINKLLKQPPVMQGVLSKHQFKQNHTTHEHTCEYL